MIKIIISVMERPKPVSLCSCNLKLGLEQISSHDIHTTTEIERKYKLVNQAIHFHGPCGSTKKCTIKDKINELKARLGDYFFNQNNRLIAITNQIVISPVEPVVLDTKEANEKRKKRYAHENDAYYEDILHQAIINTLKESGSDGSVMEGFYSWACLGAKLELGKQERKGSQCQCKTDCNCKKEKFAALNDHEMEVLEILDFKDDNREEIEICTQLLKAFKLEDSITTSQVESQAGTFLFNKV